MEKDAEEKKVVASSARSPPLLTINEDRILFWPLVIGLFVVGISDRRIASFLYVPESETWYPIEVPPWLRALGPGDPESGSPHGRLELPTGGGCRSTGGGVLLSTTFMQGERKIVIPHLGNPVTDSWACLPELPVGLRIQHVLGVFVDAKARCFKLVALYETRNDMHTALTTHVFDSALGRWSKTTAALPRSEAFNSILTDRGVFIDTALYCVAGDCTDGHCNLWTYDLGRAYWRWLKLPMPSKRVFHVVYCNLANIEDRLLCVALGRREGETMCRIEIWEVGLNLTGWIRVAAMPPPMLPDFLGRWRCPPRNATLCHRLQLKVVALPDSQVFIMNDELEQIVLLNMSQRPYPWCWLPWPCKHFVRKSLHCLNGRLDLGSWKQVQKHV